MQRVNMSHIKDIYPTLLFGCNLLISNSVFAQNEIVLSEKLGRNDSVRLFETSPNQSYVSINLQTFLDDDDLSIVGLGSLKRDNEIIASGDCWVLPHKSSVANKSATITSFSVYPFDPSEKKNSRYTISPETNGSKTFEKYDHSIDDWIMFHANFENQFHVDNIDEENGIATLHNPYIGADFGSTASEILYIACDKESALQTKKDRILSQEFIVTPHSISITSYVQCQYNSLWTYSKPRKMQLFCGLTN